MAGNIMHTPIMPAGIYVGPLWVVQLTALKYMCNPNPLLWAGQPTTIKYYALHACWPTYMCPHCKCASWLVGKYVCYTYATIRTDMAWDTSNICLLQACHPPISPSPIGLGSNLVIIPGSFCPTHTSHSVLPIATSLSPLCQGSVSTLIPFDCEWNPDYFDSKCFIVLKINNNKKYIVFWNCIFLGT